MGAQGRQPEPPMTNWGNVSKNHASIPQDTAEHNRDCQQTRASCLLPRVLVLHRFPTAALELMNKKKIDELLVARKEGCVARSPFQNSQSTWSEKRLHGEL